MINDTQQLKSQADALKKQGRFADAIPLYRKLWEETVSSDSPDKWLGWNYAQCLRKNGQPEVALEVCRAVYRLDSSFDHNNSLYGWCIYDIGIKQTNETFGEEQFLKAAHGILQLTTQGEFSPYTRTVLKVIKYYEAKRRELNEKKSLAAADFKNKRELNQNIIEWLDQLDVSLLSVQADKRDDGTTYESEREDWYNSRAKALLDLERFEECAEVCAKALGDLREIHNGYDVWFRWYGAQSLIAIKQFGRAVDYFDYILKQKQDFWVYHQYAICLSQLGRTEDAIRQLSEAALPSRGLGFRWEIYLDLGTMLEQVGENELAAKHFMLAAAIRKEEGWEKTPETLRSSLERHRISLDDLPVTKSLHGDLQTYWKSMKPRPQTSNTGVIEILHENGKSGIIRGDDRSKYFFGMRNYKDTREATLGLRVGFNLRPEVSKRTGQTEMHAFDVWILPE